MQQPISDAIALIDESRQLINESAEHDLVVAAAMILGGIIGGYAGGKLGAVISKARMEPILTKIYNRKIAVELSAMLEISLSGFKSMLKIIPIQKAYNVAYADISAFFKDDQSLKNKKLRKNVAISYHGYLKVQYELGFTDSMRYQLDPTFAKIEQLIKKL